MELLNNIFWLCLIPLFGLLTAAAVSLVKAKRVEIEEKTDSEILKKYIGMLDKTITDCVIATNQTYVNNLKDKNAFDVKAQKEAFNATFNAVMNILTEDAKEYLSNAFGDLALYLTNKIETEVKLNK